MHADVAALLAVQEDDVVIHDLETRLAALAPRLDALAREHDRALGELARARDAAETEERRRRDVEQRVAQHRQLQDRNQSMLNSVKSEREAAAATAQLEQAGRMIAEDERQIASLSARIAELRETAEERERAANRIAADREQARAAMGADSRMIEEQLAQARADREKKAAAIPRAVLQRYERIRSKKRVRAVFPLRGSSCSHCDTLIPLQRRSGMAGTGAMELCEGCGVLLYAAD